MAKLSPDEFIPDEPVKLAPEEFVPDEVVQAPAAEPSNLSKMAGFIKKAAGTAHSIQTAPQRVVSGWLTGADEPLTKELSPDQPVGAAIRGVGNGFAFGAMPKINGAAAAFEGFPFRLPNLDAYEPAKKQAEHDDDYSREQQPFAYGGGEIAAAVASPNPFGKLGAGLGAAGKVAGRVAGASGQGGLYAAASSRAPSWSGSEGQPGVAEELAQGSGIGGAFGAAVEPVTALHRGLGALKQQGAKRAETLNADLLQKDFSSERGRLGGVTTGTKTDLRDAELFAKDGDIDPEIRRTLEEWLTGEQAKLTKNTTARSLSERLPQRQGEMDQARAAMDVAKDRASPQGVRDATSEYLGKSTLVEDVAPRVDRLIGNKMVSSIAEFGGAPIQTVKNLGKNPRFQFKAGKTGEALMAPLAGAANMSVNPATRSLADYLQKKPDDEREEDAADFYSRGGK